VTGYWKKLQGPASREVMEQYIPYFTPPRDNDYSEVRISAKKPPQSRVPSWLGGKSKNPSGLPSEGETFTVTGTVLKSKGNLELIRLNDGKTFPVQVGYIDKNAEEMKSLPLSAMARSAGYYGITIQMHPNSMGKKRWLPNKDITFVLEGVPGYTFGERLLLRKVIVYDEAADIAKYRNPESSAVDVFTGFHGREPESIIEYRYEEHEHENLAGLGDLVQLKFVTPADKEVDLNAPDPECGDLTKIVKLCCSEDRTQLYFVGGDQAMSEADLSKMGFKAGKNDFKDLMLLGVLTEVTYRTEKGFDNFKLVDYYHELGEETGNAPVLLYDFRSGLLRVAGGQYLIEDRGIVN
jgi:hypothetical protein